MFFISFQVKKEFIFQLTDWHEDLKRRSICHCKLNLIDENKLPRSAWELIHIDECLPLEYVTDVRIVVCFGYLLVVCLSFSSNCLVLATFCCFLSVSWFLIWLLLLLLLLVVVVVVMVVVFICLSFGCFILLTFLLKLTYVQRQRKQTNQQNSEMKTIAGNKQEQDRRF